MKKVYLLLICLIAFKSVQAQIPAVKWEEHHFMEDIVSRVDFGYLAVGDNFQSNRNAVVKCIDDNGKIIWKKEFGGALDDAFTSIVRTIDGNFVCAGYSYSTDGDVLCNTGGYVLWLVKIDRFGNIIWSKCFNTSNRLFYTNVYYDNNILIKPTNDTSVICVSFPEVYKINNNGNIIWKDSLSLLAGSGANPTAFDLELKPNNNLVFLNVQFNEVSNVFGPSSFNIYNVVGGQTFILDQNSGNLNQQYLQSTPAYRSFLNNKGSFSIGQSPGNPSGPHCVPYNPISTCVGPFKLEQDYTLYYSSGSLGIFQQSCNTTDQIPYPKIFKITKYSYKNAPPTITTIDDSTMILTTVESHCVPTLPPSSPCPIQSIYRGYLATSRNGYMTVNDFIYPSQYNYKNFKYLPEKKVFISLNDYLITCSKERNVNYITGFVFRDDNNNGIKDVGEYVYTGLNLAAKNSVEQASSFARFNNDKSYTIETYDLGQYTTKVNNFLKPYHNIVPLSDTSVFTGEDRTDTINFALQPIPNKTDMQIALISTDIVRPGFNANYKMIVRNTGTTTPNCTIKLLKPATLTYLSATPTATVSGDTLIWKTNNFNIDSSMNIDVNFAVANTLVFGDTLRFLATVASNNTDETPADNQAWLIENVLGSYDPNDKNEAHNGKYTLTALGNKEPLIYTIRFQNTGNDTAFTVKINDTLDGNLDINSFEPIAASHGYSVTIRDNKYLSFTFNNILLVDSNHNEPKSHGFISYRITPKATVVHNDIIKNTASIYFDYNLPVKTNTTNTVIINTALPVQLKSFAASLSSVKTVNLNWLVATETNVKHYQVERSNASNDFAVVTTVPAANKTEYAAKDMQPAKGINYYRLKVVDRDGKFNYSNVVAINLATGQQISIYPNPATNQITINRSIGANTSNIEKMSIVNILGKTVLQVQLTNPQQSFDISNLPQGVYVLSFESGEKLKLVKE